MYCSLRVFSAAICFCALSFPAHAVQIQMLPPVTEATKNFPNPTPCPSGATSNVLTWDGKAAIACANGVTASGGNIAATGSIAVGQTNNACSAAIAGTMRYNTSNNVMEYCNGTQWGPLGGASPQGTLCGNVFWEI